MPEYPKAKRRNEPHHKANSQKSHTSSLSTSGKNVQGKSSTRQPLRRDGQKNSHGCTNTPTRRIQTSNLQKLQYTARGRRKLPRPNKTEKRTSSSSYMPRLRPPNARAFEKEKRGKQNMSKITTRMKRHIRHELKDEKPTLWIGKDGLTPQLSNEIENQLEKKKMLKIKILRSALQQDTAQTIASKAAEQAGASLVEVRGHVFILYRRRKK